MNVETLPSAILRERPNINKWQRDFFQHHLGLFLTLRGRYTYLNFERYGQKSELTYRNHHESRFDFRTFNQILIEKHTGSRRMMAFDPSYIPKSGKRTPGLGYFWSGSAGRVKWGLELCGFAAVDIEASTALHYFAAQTLLEDGQGLMGFYCDLLRQQAPESLKMSQYLGVDAFFSRKSSPLRLTPNPAHELTRFEVDDDWSGQGLLRLTNTTGAEVRTITVQKPAGPWVHTLLISDLPAGAYRVSLLLGERHYEGYLLKPKTPQTRWPHCRPTSFAVRRHFFYRSPTEFLAIKTSSACSRVIAPKADHRNPLPLLPILIFGGKDEKSCFAHSALCRVGVADVCRGCFCPAQP